MVTRRDWYDAFKCGCLSFGGPAGQIALMHRTAVTEKAEISEEEFQAALSFCMFLPGPEALQLAIFLGWRRLGWLGGVVAGLGFLVPGMAMTFALAAGLVLGKDLAPVLALLAGLKVVAVALVVDALWRLFERLRSTSMLNRPDRSAPIWQRPIFHQSSGILISALAMVSLIFKVLPYPLIVAGAALLGALNPPVHSRRPIPGLPRRSAPWLAVGSGLVVWLMVSLLIYGWSGDALLWRIHLFFSQVSVMGFGGAYAVVAWVRDAFVSTGAQMQEGDWIAGLALTETTPGPLTLVLPFYGFLAMFHQTLSVTTALVSGVVLSVSIFLPSFVMVIGFGRYLTLITNSPRALSALRGVTHAVLGVIAVFALNLLTMVCWSNQTHDLERWPVLGVLLALGLLRFWRWSLEKVVGLFLALPLIGYFLKTAGVAF